jgi:hypothetical protein
LCAYGLKEPNEKQTSHDSVSKPSSALNQVNNQDDDGNNEEEMDQTAANVAK